jgi:hypothetical protein
MYITVSRKKGQITYTLKPYLKAWEETFDCRITLHDYVHFLFSEGQPLYDPWSRCFHRRTFPEQCGKEFRPYCIRYCMNKFNERIGKNAVSGFLHFSLSICKVFFI